MSFVKLILTGGYNPNNYTSIRDGVLFTRGNELCRALELGEKILVITAAKPVGIRNSLIRPLVSRGAKEVDREYIEKVNWEEYDWVIALGGNTTSLFSKLKQLKFNNDVLKESVTYIGESAGAMLQASHYYVYNMETKEINFREGLLPGSNRIFVVHSNDPKYVDDFLRERVEKFALEKNIQVIELAENEEMEILV